MSAAEVKTLQLQVQTVLADIERMMRAIEADLLWQRRCAQAEPLRSRLVGRQAQFFERLELVQDSRARRCERLRALSMDVAVEGLAEHALELERQHAAELRFLPAALALRDEVAGQLTELRALQGLPPLFGLESVLN